MLIPIGLFLFVFSVFDIQTYTLISVITIYNSIFFFALIRIFKCKNKF